MKKLKVEDLFEIEYEETDPGWFRLVTKPEFAKHRIRIVSEKMDISIHHAFKQQESISIAPTIHDSPKKFNSISLDRYEKKSEQAYRGYGEIYITVKEVKQKTTVRKNK